MRRSFILVAFLILFIASCTGGGTPWYETSYQTRINTDTTTAAYIEHVTGTPGSLDTPIDGTMMRIVIEINRGAGTIEFRADSPGLGGWVKPSDQEDEDDGILPRGYCPLEGSGDRYSCTLDLPYGRYTATIETSARSIVTPPGQVYITLDSTSSSAIVGSYPASPPPPGPGTTCADQGGSCKTICGADETSGSGTCPSGETCCIPETVTGPCNGGADYTWITICNNDPSSSLCGVCQDDYGCPEWEETDTSACCSGGQSWCDCYQGCTTPTQCQEFEDNGLCVP